MKHIYGVEGPKETFRKKILRKWVLPGLWATVVVGVSIAMWVYP